MEIGIEEDERLQQTALRRKLHVGFIGHVMQSDGLEKKNDAGIRRRKEERRATKEKMDERDT